MKGLGVQKSGMEAAQNGMGLRNGNGSQEWQQQSKNFSGSQEWQEVQAMIEVSRNDKEIATNLDQQNEVSVVASFSGGQPTQSKAGRLF